MPRTFCLWMDKAGIASSSSIFLSSISSPAKFLFLLRRPLPRFGCSTSSPTRGSSRSSLTLAVSLCLDDLGCREILIKSGKSLNKKGNNYLSLFVVFRCIIKIRFVAFDSFCSANSWLRPRCHSFCGRCRTSSWCSTFSFLQFGHQSWGTACNKKGVATRAIFASHCHLHIFNILIN